MIDGSTEERERQRQCVLRARNRATKAEKRVKELEAAMPDPERLRYLLLVVPKDFVHVRGWIDRTANQIESLRKK